MVEPMNPAAPVTRIRMGPSPAHWGLAWREQAGVCKNLVRTAAPGVWGPGCSDRLDVATEIVAEPVALRAEVGGSDGRRRDA